MLKALTVPIRKFLNAYGYEVVKLQDALTTVKVGNWLHKLEIKTIIDVGSNEGQFLHAINKTLPNRKIYAFEPIAECYEKLLVSTKAYDVTVYNCGLSDYNGISEINVSGNLVSSSILGMNDLHESLYPESQYMQRQQISLKRMDDVFAQEQIQKNILIKIDVQGYEEKVLKGGDRTISECAVVIIETSFTSLYEGQWLFENVHGFFIDRNFRFAGFADQSLSKQTGVPLYGDAIFVRNDLSNLIY
jgi:FkbM family methyltransferase